MGFNGCLILACTETPIGEIQAIVDRDDDTQAAIAYEGGWQLGRSFGAAIANDVKAILDQLIRCTDKPALICHVLDSDSADLAALGLSGDAWRACLVPTVMMDYAPSELGLDFASAFLSPKAATDRAAGWAVDAGLHPHEAGILSLFASQDRGQNAEHELLKLIAYLGVPGSKLSDQLM